MQTNIENADNLKKTDDLNTKNYHTLNSDTVYFKNKIIISIIPSDKYLDSIQKVVPEDEWNEVASDNEYYRDLTEKYLIEKGYTLVVRPKNRFWSFKLFNGNTHIIDSHTINEKWGNLIYNGKDSAFIFEGTVPDIELKNKI